MALDIVLVRHGESEGNRDGIFTSHGAWGLTPRGERQAAATARALAAADRAPLRAIYSSDLPRSLDTATPFAALVGMEVRATAALRERSVGAFTGLTFQQVQERFPDGWQALLTRDADFRPPGGESHRDCRARVGRFLAEVLAHHSDGRVVLYSHGVAINHLLREVMDIDPASARFFFQISNCALCRFERRDDGTFRIFAINDRAHLVGVNVG